MALYHQITIHYYAENCNRKKKAKSRISSLLILQNILHFVMKCRLLKLKESNIYNDFRRKRVHQNNNRMGNYKKLASGVRQHLKDILGQKSGNFFLNLKSIQ